MAESGVWESCLMGSALVALEWRSKTGSEDVWSMTTNIWLSLDLDYKTHWTLEALASCSETLG
jgi:hypothetical protein